MYNLHLRARLIDSDPPRSIANITGLAKDWKRSIRARGGYWLGSFEIRDVSRDELLWWYNYRLGHHIEEQTFGVTSWEGLIYEMTLTLDGIQYRRTLDKEWWHNRVKVLYRDGGAQAETDWSEDTDSSGEYGQMDYIDTLSEATASAAEALRDGRLAEFAYPKSRMTGGLEFSSKPREGTIDNLQVIVAGYVFTMNWLVRETSIEATAANSAISTLVGASEFVTAGDIDTNSLSVDVDCSTPQRLWDAINDVIAQGDAVGNRWVGGVYADRKFNYNQAQVSAVDYYVRNGQLVDQGGMAVIPSRITPDIIVTNTNAPSEG